MLPHFKSLVTVTTYFFAVNSYIRCRLSVEVYNYNDIFMQIGLLPETIFEQRNSIKCLHF